MSQNSVQLTRFHVERLQCIGGEGRAAPYRITTYPGRDLGLQGQVMDADLEALNGPSSERAPLAFVSGLLQRLASRLNLRGSAGKGR